MDKLLIKNKEYELIKCSFPRYALYTDTPEDYAGLGIIVNPHIVLAIENTDLKEVQIKCLLIGNDYYGLKIIKNAEKKESGEKGGKETNEEKESGQDPKGGHILGTFL